jgi:syndecan 4
MPTATPTLKPTPEPSIPLPPTPPPSPGGECSTNVDCYERGNCVGGVCQCSSGYTCDDCSITWQEYFDADSTCPPPMEIPAGGADCIDNSGGTNNFYCYNHGTCRSSTGCSCLTGWVCADCQHKLDDILSGREECNEERVLPEVGGHPCTGDADCLNQGRCRDGKCDCNSGRACPDCSATDLDIFNGVASCPTPPGLGDIDIGGGSCDIDSECSGHGRCTSTTCSCDTGYVCDHCSISTEDFVNGVTECPDHAPPPVGGMSCTSSVDCGVGTCRGGKCQCFSEHVCEDCSLTANEYWLDGIECSTPSLSLEALLLID